MARTSRISDRISEVEDRAADLLDEAERRWPPLVLLVAVVDRWRRANGAVLAGHIAFRMVVFLVPFVLFVIAAVGLAQSSSEVQRSAEESFGVGRALASTLADASSQADESRIQLLLLAGFATLVAAWGLLGALQAVIASIWGVPKKIDSKVMGLVKFVSAGVLLLGVYAVRQALTRSGIVLTGVGALLSLAATSVGVFGLTWMLPRRATSWIDLVPGAVLTGAGITALNMLGGWYFTSKLQRSAELYGSAGIVITIMLYMFFAAEILVIAVVVDTVWFDREELLAVAPAKPTPDGTGAEPAAEREPDPRTDELA